MHYIIGTEIYVPTTASMNSGGLQPVNAQHVQKKNQGIGPFAAGLRYQLHNIRQVKEGYEYRFLVEGQEVPMVFASVQQAEEYIAAARQESLPNYSSFHLRRKD